MATPTRRTKARKGARRKTTISLDAETVFKLDVLAARKAQERGRAVDRCALIEELLAPSLRGIVVTIRAGADAHDEAAA